MRPPTYTPREMEAFGAADRVVARVCVMGDWKEQELFPSPGQSVRDKLAEVQHAIRHNRDFSKISLYVGGEVRGERMIASVRHDQIPDELQR